MNKTNHRTTYSPDEVALILGFLAYCFIKQQSCNKWKRVYQLASFYIAGILAGICIAKVEYNFTFIFFTVLFLIITIFEYHYYFKEQKFINNINKGMTYMGELAIVDTTGDTKVLWDKTKQAEVDNAKKMFNRLKKQGYIAYTVKDNGKRGEVIQSFDVNLERIIMHKPVVGG